MKAMPTNFDNTLDVKMPTTANADIAIKIDNLSIITDITNTILASCPLEIATVRTISPLI